MIIEKEISNLKKNYIKIHIIYLKRSSIFTKLFFLIIKQFLIIKTSIVINQQIMNLNICSWLKLNYKLFV